MLSRIKIVLLRLSIAMLGGVVLCNLVVGWSYFKEGDKELQAAPVVIIFGAGLTNTGEQTKMQYDRVEKGIELYKSGLASKIVITGDDGARWGKEVQAMEAQVLAAGIPSTNIEIDYHGYRTYDSCYRLKNLYSIDNAIVVSQEFHLARIKYLCEHFGMKTQEVAADKQDYGIFLFKSEIRELLARVKAWLNVHVYSPMPVGGRS